jgi:hypothetical protein
VVAIDPEPTGSRHDGAVVNPSAPSGFGECPYPRALHCVLRIVWVGQFGSSYIGTYAGDVGGRKAIDWHRDLDLQSDCHRAFLSVLVLLK